MEQKEERKHLFGSTEKSDFIVNMTEKQYQKLGFIYLALSAIVILVMNIPYYVSKGKTIFAVKPFDKLNLQTLKYVDTSYIYGKCSGFISYLQIAIYAISFIGFLILIISATKQYFKAGENKLFILPVIYMLFVVVSTFMAYNIKYAFLGRDYRYNGMLTMFSYIGLFVAASQINSRERRKTYLDIFVAISLINAVYGILQIIPRFVTEIPNFFYEMTSISGNSSKSYEYFIADGLVQTPHALAALMTMALAVAAAGFAYDTNKARKLVYAVCCPIFAAAGFATCTLAAYIGIPFVILVILIVEIVRIISRRIASSKAKGKKNVILSAQKPIISVIAAIILVGGAFGVMTALDRVAFHDYNIVWKDSAERLGASYPYAEDLDYSDSLTSIHIYPRIWKECVTILKDSWVFGGGPDCIGFEHYGTTDLYNAKLGFSVDRSYNEYFDIALACGLPCLLIYLAMGFVTIKKGVRNVANFFKREDSWTAVAILAAVLGYGLQANVNISLITVTPFFFIFVGLVWNRPHDAEEKPAKNDKKIKE